MPFFPPYSYPATGVLHKITEDYDCFHIHVSHAVMYVRMYFELYRRRDSQILDITLSPKKNSCYFWIKHNVGVQQFYKLWLLRPCGKKTNLYTNNVSTRSVTIFSGNDIVWNFDILIDDIDVVSKAIEYRCVPRKPILFYLIKFCLDFHFFFKHLVFDVFPSPPLL